MVKSIAAWTSWEDATPTSRDLFERASRVLPGGVLSPVRGVSAFDPYPIYMDRGEGAYLFDVDGNRYVDLVLGLGPIILGHNAPSVVEAVREQVGRGSLFGTCTPLEIEVAERMCRMAPGIEMVRFTNSGTESTMHAMRLARGFTGRPNILKFEGHFHGNHDQVLLNISPPFRPNGEQIVPYPVGRGIPPAHYSAMVLGAWNDVDAVARIIEQHKDDLAAVMLEPIMANKGFIPPEPGYLEALRELTESNGMLLILDEVVTGFRLAQGGAQEFFSIRADLVTYAKAMANGATIGAFGGRSEIMRLLGTMEVRHAGTYNGGLVPLAAARATLGELATDDGAAYRHLDRLGEQLRSGLRAAISRHGVNAIVQGAASMMQLYFTPRSKIRDYQETRDLDGASYRRFANEMISRGVLIHPDPYEHWFLSTAHTSADIDYVLAAADESMEVVSTAST
jgi:glutamate-1-semialdehyde 2,1-aminomutase